MDITEHYQEFFEFMIQEHDIILTIDQMDNIRREAIKLNDKLCQI